MNIQENISLASYTTFKIGGPARFFCIVRDEGELLKAARFAKDKNLRLKVLGGGSNILVSDSGFDGLVIKNEIMGIDVKMIPSENGNQYQISVGAGESWDQLVDYTVNEGLCGLENLSAIPGSVGAAPVQNIGAYGAEVADTISNVRVYDTVTDRISEFNKIECQFIYRDSIFKKNRGRYIIIKVLFILVKDGALKTDYKDVREHFSRKGINLDGLNTEQIKENITIKDMRNAIIEIRANKLPDWHKWGTAGSFFKNPIISREHFDTLKISYPGLPGFPEPDNKIKVSLGWILDKVCNVKGMRNGRARVYEKQALVLVAESGASAQEVVNLADELMKCVKKATNINIEAEVEWVN